MSIEENQDSFRDAKLEILRIFDEHISNLRGLIESIEYTPEIDPHLIPNEIKNVRDKLTDELSRLQGMISNHMEIKLREINPENVGGEEISDYYPDNFES